ncbi:TolB family protein [Sporocytophaga myxococcoides]|uniref:TolB family protein n=1 Tax=Sporocytophaga myxococcoides TaxID=153721 RepID=UPI0003F66907|nr:PD40 domain-containing protein [Sporocytophaga myxococcoides]
MKRLLVILFLLIKVKAVFAQSVFTDVNSLKNRADYYYQKLVYARAADLYAEALKKKKNIKDCDLNRKAAILFKKMSRYEEAKRCFENIQLSGHVLNSQDSIDYFNTLRAINDPKADTIFTKVHSRIVLNNLFRDSLYYNIFSLPFNTSGSEYCPAQLNKGMFYVTEEEDTSVVRKYNALNNGGFAHIYYSQKNDTGWSKSVKVSFDKENVLHIGPVAFYDSLKAIVNICVKGDQEPYRLELYSGEFDESLKKWKYLSPISINNAEYSIGHPAISTDGKQLFFVSDKQGGYGGTDIYMSLLKNGSWSEPANLGPKVNTKGDEKYPFLTDDNILFFSSDGKYGMGGLDIYYIDLLFKDSMVVNMGFPVNSNLDDFGFSYNKKAKTGYFSSNRKSNGDDDLYMYTENKVFFDLSIFDDFDKKELVDYTASLVDAELNIPIRCLPGSSPNSIKANLRPGHAYRLIIYKNDYKSDTLNISTYGNAAYTNKISKIIYLKRKHIYNASLQFKGEFSKENFSGALILINNLTEKTLDTLDNNTATATIKLDGDCEYIITSRNGDKLRYIYVERKSFRLTDLVPYYNLYLGAATPSILYVSIKECVTAKDMETSNIPEVTVWDWVNRNQFNITPGPEGDFQIVVMDDRLYDLFVDGKEVRLEGSEIVQNKYCIKYLHDSSRQLFRLKK